jgi:hypothetical protein
LRLIAKIHTSSNSQCAASLREPARAADNFEVSSTLVIGAEGAGDDHMQSRDGMALVDFTHCIEIILGVRQ